VSAVGAGPRPPGWARWLAERLVGGPDREFILGDLEQMYGVRVARAGGAVASAWFVLAALSTAGAQLRSEALAGLAQDVRLALRQFRRARQVHVSAAIVLTVGLGIATFAWGIYYAEHIRGLQIDGGDRVVELALLQRQSGLQRPDVSLHDFQAATAGTPVFEIGALVGTASIQFNDDASTPLMISALRVTPSFFELMEMRPELGRLFDAADAVPGAPRVAVLGHRFWTDRYDADPSVIGRSIRVYGEPTVVVGVLPEGARYLGSDPLWLPAGPYDDPGVREWVALMKVREHVTVEEVDAQLASVAAGLAETQPGAWEDMTLRAAPFGSAMRGPNTSAKVTMLSWTGVLLYLMAVANVANLFLVRARVRARELAVRRAIGAGRLRVLRQLALEASVPATLGFVGGTLLSAWALEWYRGAASIYGRGLPGPVWVHYGLELPHLAVLAFSALASTVFVSVVSAAWALRRSDAELLRGSDPARATFGLGKVLLTIEVASGGALLLFSTLLLTGTWNLRTVDYGFETESILTGIIEPGPAYPDDRSRLALYQALEAELETVSEVESVTLATQLPMIRLGGLRWIEVEGWEWDGKDVSQLPRRYADFVTPSFFRTFDRAVVRGRGFDSGDDVMSEPVALVNEHFARTYFPDGSPMGRRVRIWNGAQPGPWRSIVGVAPHMWMDTDVNAIPEGMYVPLAQAQGSWAQIGVRVRGEPGAFAPALREAVARLDPELPVTEVQTMEELIHGRTSLYRFQSPPFIAVGLAALFLALVGLWAVVSYLASLRVREYGIRSALGATRPGLVRRAALIAALPTVVGMIAGVGLGMFIVRGFERWLFLVEPWSPFAIGTTVATLGLCAALATLLPALRASRVDVVEVLRAE